MRKERITITQAQNVYDAVKNAVPTFAHHSGQCAALPDIDMQTIFAGRKSMTAAAVIRAVNGIISHIAMNKAPS